MRAFLPALLAWVFLAPTAGWADCSLVERLDRIHRAYQRVHLAAGTDLARQYAVALDLALKALPGDQLDARGLPRDWRQDGALLRRFLASGQRHAAQRGGDALGPEELADLVAVGTFLQGQDCKRAASASDSGAAGESLLSPEGEGLPGSAGEDWMRQLAEDSAIAGTIIAALAGAWMVVSRIAAWRAERTRRFDLRIAVQVGDGGGHRPLELVNVSRTGAKLELDGSRPLDRQISIQMPGQRVKGIVRWQNAHFAGVSFHRVLRRGTLTRLRNASSIASTASVRDRENRSPQSTSGAPKDAAALKNS